MCRLVSLGLLLVRENLPYTGWTQREADMLQTHIDTVWLPALKDMVRELHQEEEAKKVLRVIKTHMILVHSTPRLLTLGSLLVLVPTVPCLTELYTPCRRQVLAVYLLPLVAACVNGY